MNFHIFYDIINLKYLEKFKHNKNFAINQSKIKKEGIKCMKILAFLKKLFSKKTPYTTAISNFSDLITLPNREELKSSKEKIALLDELKAAYQEKISVKKTIVSSQLEMNTLREKMDMYINLMFSLLEVDEPNLLSLTATSIDQDSIKNFTYLLKMAKLKLYFYNILNLETETTLRLVALKELSEELTIFSRSKKRTIAEEINNLSGILLVFLNQRQAISLELENYLKDYSILKKEETIPAEELNELQIEKHNELLRMLSCIDQTKKSPLHASKLDITSIVLIEQELETYVYTHKSEVEAIRTKIALLTSESQKMEPPQNLSRQVEDLELKCKIFSEYGRKLLNDDDIYALYNLKFNLFTKDLITRDIDLKKYLEHANFLELSLYQEIIMDKINAILTNTNPEIVRVFGDNTKEAIEIISSTLKDEKKGYEPDKILKQKINLCLLVSFDKPNGIYEFFEKYIVTRLLEPLKEYQGHTDYFFNLFVWADTLPLYVIYDIMYFNESIKNPDENLTYFNGLYKLYVQLYKSKPSAQNQTFKLLEGIRKIREFDSSKLFLSEQKFIENMHRAAICKTLLFPTTLREINGNLFRNCYVKNIILNKGLQKIACDAFHAVDFDTLTIPASVSDIEYAAFNIRNTNEFRTDKSRFDDLILDDIYESQLTEESIVNLIMTFFYVEDEHPLKRENKTVENARIKYKLFRSTSYHCIPNCKYDFKIDTLEVFPAFERLILRENGEDILILTKKDLTFLINRLFVYNPVYGKEETYQYCDYYIFSKDEEGPCIVAQDDASCLLSKLEAQNLTTDIRDFIKGKLQELDKFKTKTLKKEEQNRTNHQI